MQGPVQEPRQGQGSALGPGLGPGGAEPRRSGWPVGAGGLAAAYLGLCLLPLALALARPVAPAHPWEHLAAGLGMTALAALAAQLVTSGRLRPVSDPLGIDKVMAFHKISAWWVVLALALHPLAYVVPTWVADPGLGQERLSAYLTLPQYRSGVVALAALLLLLPLSVLRDRLPWRYELWRATHLLLAAVALFGGLHHALAVGRFAAIDGLRAYWLALGLSALAVLALLYGWRWLRLHRRPWRLASVTRRADRMWELDLQPAPGTPPLDYAAGQFVWMTTGRRRFPLFDHPFSIADSPLRPGLSLLVKEAGDYTGAIGGLPPGTPVGIDGPYGHFTLGDHPADAVLLIAGGVGIAPVLGILRDLVQRRDRRPVRLAYAVGDPANFACLDEIAAAAEVLDLVHLPVSETGGPGWQGAIGRIDRARLSALLDGIDPSRCVALICGPGPMVTALSDTLADLGLPDRAIIYERFDYGGGASRQDRRLRRRYLALGAGLGLGAAGFVALVG